MIISGLPPVINLANIITFIMSIVGLITIFVLIRMTAATKGE